MVYRKLRFWSLICVSFLILNAFRLLSRDAESTTKSIKLRNQDFNGYQKFSIYCQPAINGDQAEFEKLKNITKPKWSFKSIKNLNCTEYRLFHGFDNIFVTEEEKEFPIAFNILLHKDLPQVEFLLRAIYRPQNFYCLHVDGYSPPEFHSDASKLADCFNNVFIVSKTLNIIYAGFNRLQADINCMEDHLALSSSWKYLINLPGQQFPLKTNAEIVQILKVYNNSNDIHGDDREDKIKWERFYNKFIVNRTSYYPHRLVMTKTKIKHEKPPHGLKVYKGSAYGIFSRGFVDYIVNNKVSHDLLKWCKDVYSPDEYFWAMLHHNKHLQVPGGYSGDDINKPHLATYVAWIGCGSHDVCYGKMKRCVCVFSVKDLKNLVNKRELFVNKFDFHYDPIALQCLSEWLYNKTVYPQTLDLEYYKTLPFVQNHF